MQNPCIIALSEKNREIADLIRFSRTPFTCSVTHSMRVAREIVEKAHYVLHLSSEIRIIRMMGVQHYTSQNEKIMILKAIIYRNYSKEIIFAANH